MNHPFTPRPTYVPNVVPFSKYSNILSLTCAQNVLENDRNVNHWRISVKLVTDRQTDRQTSNIGRLWFEVCALFRNYAVQIGNIFNDVSVQPISAIFSTVNNPTTIPTIRSVTTHKSANPIHFAAETRTDADGSALADCNRLRAQIVGLNIWIV